MRSLLFITLLLGALFCASNAGASKNKLAAPQSIEINFEHGNKVNFKVSEGAVSALTVTVSHAVLVVPQSICARLKSVHFETVVLVYGGHTQAITKDDWFSVRFSTGHESERFMNLLPEVEIEFRDGKYNYASIMKRQGDTWVTEAL